MSKFCTGLRLLRGGCLLARHVFPEKPLSGKVAGLILALFPVTIFKNGLRIVTISWFSVHPNQHFLTVLLHKDGGIPLSFLVFSVLAFLVMWLSQSDNSAWKGDAG